MDGYIDMDGLVEVRGIEPHYWLDLRKIKYLSCHILNFSGYFPSNSGIPLTIFTVISPNISSSDLDLVVSGG